VKKLAYRVVHGFLIVLDMIATVTSLPWMYTDKHKRKMKERIDGKK